MALVVYIIIRISGGYLKNVDSSLLQLLQNNKREILEPINTRIISKVDEIDLIKVLDNEKDKLEIFEQERIQSALNSFALAPAPKVKIKPKKVLQKPSVQSEQSVRVRPIIIPSQENIDSFLNASSCVFDG